MASRHLLVFPSVFTVFLLSLKSHMDQSLTFNGFHSASRVFPAIKKVGRCAIAEMRCNSRRQGQFSSLGFPFCTLVISHYDNFYLCALRQSEQRQNKQTKWRGWLQMPLNCSLNQRLAVCCCFVRLICGCDVDFILSNLCKLGTATMVYIVIVVTFRTSLQLLSGVSSS